jgi:glycosyltransferase involved in cell wall biosynthesis
MMPTPQYVVAQVGARRGYAVPAMLDSAGMLSAFYTDICGNVGVGRMLALARSISAAAARLHRRQVPPSLVSRTHTFPIRTSVHACRGRFGGSEIEQFRAHLQWQLSMGRRVEREGFGRATHFFSMLGEFPRLIAEAKRRGLVVVSEVYTVLSQERILADERKQFPTWEPGSYDFDSVRREIPSGDLLLTASDYFVCPSEFVRDDVVAHFGVPASRTVVVPYGVDRRWLGLTPVPHLGRVLFVGSAGLRKGLHYLAMAAQKLAVSDPRMEFRVAGDVTQTIVSQPSCRHLRFLGRVPRYLIHREFEAADVFVLPSLAEGSAEVTYEALAAGLPVITTRSAGSVVRDGVEGRIVPERDPEALAGAILELTLDRGLRERMSIAARERARQFTWERYGERLLAYLESLPHQATDRVA